ncbi:serine hydrolase domain-containing protein [Kribbella italica]|uniref:CubicO group peptidase (Beta-lactamase class C family) n=1 Tax=Kribbella italica TaxID=1540520 RepID=A0A7W9MUN5_9ACTN|nr:CubicO group peptidase (beta-lactamase class C family) [Kribbella italica]
MGVGSDVLREQIAGELERFAVPGAGWAVIGGGEIVGAGAAGVVDATGGVEVSTGTLFQACSISKPVTVFAMLRLVDRGLLELDEDVNRRLTSWQVPQTGNWQPVVTLRQLATHSAGLTVHGFPGYSSGEPLPTTVQILDGVRPTNTFGVRVDTVPGAQFRYSGGGTVVLQQLLEDVTGTPFRELVRELVLEPSGMADSDYAQPLPDDLHERAATAHDEQGLAIPGRWHSYPELAAAGLWTTPSDLCRFALAVQAAYVGADGALLSPELGREMLTPQVRASDRLGGLNHLGLGVFLGAGGVRFGHSGGNRGFKCHLLADRESGVGAAVMTNGDNGMWVVQRAFAALASAYGWSGYDEPLDDWDVPGDDVLDGLVGKYRLRDGFGFVVDRLGGGVEVTFDGQEPMRFIPVDGSTFASSMVSARLRLRGDDLVFEQNGEQLECSRDDRDRE